MLSKTEFAKPVLDKSGIASLFHWKAPQIVNDPMNQSSIPRTRVVGAGGTGQGCLFLARLVQIDYIGHIQEHREVYS